jgi:repressor LexA
LPPHSAAQSPASASLRSQAVEAVQLHSIDLRLSFAYSQDTAAHPARVSEDQEMLPLTKRQREILDYLNEFIGQHGYAPSLEEIGRRFGLSSLATVHKHLTNLQEKGFIKRAWNRSRSVEMMPTRTGGRALELPLLGYVAAGLPIEAIASNETIAVPEDLVGKRDTYVLRVRGDSMIDEQIRDGDFVVVEDRKTAENGEMVIALLRGSDVTLKKFYRDPGGKIRLQPANAAMQPIFADPEQVQIQGVVVGVMRKY